MSTALSDFTDATLLGEGAYSAVYRVVRKADGQTYALKKVKLPTLSEKEKQNALNEVRLLASVQHPAIISFKQAFFDTSSKCLCIVQEYADAGDLYHKIVHQQKQRMYLREPEIWRIFIGMSIGLHALHSGKILWRDCKSANVFLFHNGLVKIGDFNVSKVAKRGLLYTQTGTPYFASPEIWRDMPYDEKADLWSLGAVLYECTSLRPPFRAEDMEGLYKKVIRGVYPKIPACYSQDLADVISMLLQVNPIQRPTVAQLLNSAVLQRHIDEAPKYEGLGPNFASVSTVSPASSSAMPAFALLQTIKLPKNTGEISSHLPQSRYEDGKSGTESHDGDLSSRLPRVGLPAKPAAEVNTGGDALQPESWPLAVASGAPRNRPQFSKPPNAQVEATNEGSTGATSVPSSSIPPAPLGHRRGAGPGHYQPGSLAGAHAGAGAHSSLVDRYLAGARLMANERSRAAVGAPGGPLPSSSLAAAHALYGNARPTGGVRGNLPPAVAQLLGVPNALPALYARPPPRQPRRLPGMPGI